MTPEEIQSLKWLTYDLERSKAMFNHEARAAAASGNQERATSMKESAELFARYTDALASAIAMGEKALKGGA